jgi:competence protein ComEA
MDKKTIAGAAAIAVGAAAGAAVLAFDVLKPGEDQAEGRSNPSEGEAKPQTAGMVNINRAAPKDLMTLRHVGRGRAKRILASRPFRTLEELHARGIIPMPVFEEIKDRLTL